MGTDTQWTGPMITWLKIWEGYLRNEESQTHTRPSSPGFQGQEDKSPQLLAAKTNGDWVSGRNFWSPKKFLLQNPHTDWSMQTHSSTRAAAWKAQVVYRERLKWLASRWAEADVPLLSPPRTGPPSWCHIWDSINLVHTVWPTLEIPRGSAPLNLRTQQAAFPEEWLDLSPKSYQTSNSWFQWALAAARLDSQLGFTRESPRLEQVAAISDCFTIQAGCSRQNIGGGWPWPVPLRKPQIQHNQWTATDQAGAPPPCPCTADPPQRAEDGGKCSQPVLAADWPD